MAKEVNACPIWSDFMVLAWASNRIPAGANNENWYLLLNYVPLFCKNHIIMPYTVASTDDSVSCKVIDLSGSTISMSDMEATLDGKFIDFN